MSEPLALNLTSEYGYVLAAAAASFFVNTYHVTLTSKFRKIAKLPYPIPYADQALADKDPKAYAFNCAQRAHSNFTENHTPFLGALLISGLKYPVFSAGLGATWVLSRVIYAWGYTSSGPKGRMVGSIGHFLTDATLKFTAMYTALSLALKW